MEERGYQISAVKDCVDYIYNERERGGGISVLPTGAGKSFIIAMIVEALSSVLHENNILLVIQPTEELLVQNLEKIEYLGVDVSVYSASLNRKEIGRVTYATIGSLNDISKFKGKVFTIIQDECHLATKSGTQFSTFVKSLGLKRFIGLTASPIYLMNTMGASKLVMMNRSRGGLYNKIINCTQIEEMIRLKYWSKIVYDVYDLDSSYLKLNSTGVGYTEESMDAYYQANDIFSLLDEIQEEHHDRKSILVFTSTIEQAEIVAKYLGAECVHSKTPKKLRRDIVARFKALRIRIVVTVTALATGFDHPLLDHIIDMQPTNSLQIHYQKWGRGVRVHDDKKNILISDLGCNFDKFGKLEDLKFLDIKGYGWGAFSKDLLLTNVYLNIGERVYIRDLLEPVVPTENDVVINKDSDLQGYALDIPVIKFGKYKNKNLYEMSRDNAGKRYLLWMYLNFNFSSDWSQAQDKQMKRMKQIIEAYLKFLKMI